MSLIGLLGTNFSEILIEIQTFSFNKMHLKRSSAKWRPFLSRPQCVNLIRNTDMCSNITFLKLLPHFPESNELTQGELYWRIVLKRDKIAD